MATLPFLPVQGRCPSLHERRTTPTMCITSRTNTHMRTNIVIDDRLMELALRVSGVRTKKEAVELGLRTLVRLGKQAQIRRLRGKLPWPGDLDAMRTDR